MPITLPTSLAIGLSVPLSIGLILLTAKARDEILLYYLRWQNQKTEQVIVKKPITNPFILKRVIGNDARGHPIFIGVTQDPIETAAEANTRQGISFKDDDNEIHALVSFEKKDNRLEYTFQNNIQLIFEKTYDNKIIYEVTKPCGHPYSYKQLMGQVELFLISPIGLASNELDKIAELCESVKPTGSIINNLT